MVVDAHAHQIGAAARFDDAAIAEADGFGRVLRHHRHRLRQGNAFDDIAEEEGRLDQAERDVVGRQYVEQAVAGQRAGRNIARMRGAAHDVGRAHQHSESSLL